MALTTTTTTTVVPIEPQKYGKELADFLVEQRIATRINKKIQKPS